MGELWGVYCEDLGENWPRYNGTALYWEIVCNISSHPTCAQHEGWSIRNIADCWPLFTQSATEFKAWFYSIRCDLIPPSLCCCSLRWSCWSWRNKPPRSNRPPAAPVSTRTSSGRYTGTLYHYGEWPDFAWWHQAVNWTNADLLSIGTNFIEISLKIPNFPLSKINLKTLPAILYCSGQLWQWIVQGHYYGNPLSCM